jgi:hypothetical protein
MAAQESLKKEILAVSRRAENALCVDCYADDTRILTDRGFLFRTELEALLESGVTIEYACYDVAKDALVYSRGLFSRYPNRHGTLVNFTYVKPTATSRDNHLSLRVTPSHDVYVTWCDSGSAWRRVSMPDGSRVCAPPVKVKASSLPIPPCECEEAECVHSQAKVRFLAAAGGGATPREANKAQQTMYDALGLKDRAQVNAFLEIYGQSFNAQQHEALSWIRAVV